MRNNGKKKPRSRDFGCLGMSLVFLLVGVAFGSFFAVRAWRDVQTFTTWRPTTCTIVAKDIGSTGGSGKSKPSYRAEITFRHEVGGKEYRCAGWDSWALSGGYGGGSYKYYERLLGRYEVGRTPQKALASRCVSVESMLRACSSVVVLVVRHAAPQQRGGGPSRDDNDNATLVRKAV